MRFTTCIAALPLLVFPFLPISVQAQDIISDHITEQDLRAHIEILASDDFGGRKPGTVGENKTVNYIAEQWQKAGLRPASGSESATSSWYAPVSLVERAPLGQTFTFTRIDGGRKKNIGIDDDQIILRGAAQSVSLSGVPVVFAGYGNLPVKDMESAVSGKLVLIYSSSPPDAEDFPDFRTRKASAIAAGASAVIAVSARKSRFDRSARRFSRTSTTLAGEKHHARIEGQISVEAAVRLVVKAGLDARQLFKDARQEDFRPKELGVIADLSAETRVRAYQSHNVIGKIAGTRPDSGAVLFLGHWDHLGLCRPETAVDRICNGAVDNASGIALLIETAERLGAGRLGAGRLAAGQQPDRDIYFLATTAEEKGLLGARAFAENPAFPLERLVAVFNADTVAITPTGERIAVIGRGHAGLDEEIEKIALAQGREIDKTDSANAFLKRQDGYVFLEKHIPAYMITSAFSDQERLDSFLKGRYHDVGDEADDGLVLGGAAADANFHVALGRYFGSVDSYPAKTAPYNSARGSGE